MAWNVLDAAADDDDAKEVVNKLRRRSKSSAADGRAEGTGRKFMMVIDKVAKILGRQASFRLFYNGMVIIKRRVYRMVLLTKRR